MAGMEGERPQNKEGADYAGPQGRGIIFGGVDREERGSLYEDIGLTSAGFKQGVAALREDIESARAIQKNGFNGAEFVRDMLWGEAERLEETGMADPDKAENLKTQVLWGWNALAYHSFGDEVKRDTRGSFYYFFEELFHPGTREVKVNRRVAAMLDIAATALDIPHVPGQEAIPYPPELNKELDHRMEIARRNTAKK